MNIYSKMPRPRRCRWIWYQPRITYFKPVGVPLAGLEEITLTYDELEAFRLHCLEELDQTEAAEKMRISQPTFHRTLQQACKKIADALVNGKAIKIEGGDVKMVIPPGPGFRAGRGAGRGRGFGRGGPGRGRGFGRMGVPPTKCVCPNCGYEEAKVRGIPCRSKKCPKCGTPLMGA